jgi:hypothetical protein
LIAVPSLASGAGIAGQRAAVPHLAMSVHVAECEIVEARALDLGGGDQR